MIGIRYSQWEGELRRIFKANIKATGSSLSMTSMRGTDLIIEIQDDHKIMIVKDNWREELRRRYLK